jgi:hypothetical protein
MSEAESEVLNLINRRKKQADRTSLNDIRTHFGRKPYGWYPNAIWTIVARLYKRGKVEVMQGSNNLEDDEVLGALLNSAKHSTTLLEPQASFDSGAVKALKQAYKDAFDESCPFKEAKDVALAFRDKLNQMSVDVNQILARRHEYHFLQSLDSLSEKLDKLSKKEYSYFITNLTDFEDELLDTKEDLLDHIKRFINGDQIKIYDDVQTLLKGNTANFGYIDGDELETLETLVKSKTPYKGNSIQLAKAAKDSLTKKVLEAINKEKDQFNTKIGAIETDIKASEEFGKIDASQQDEILGAIKALKTKIKNERFIGNIRDEVRKLDDHFYSDQMNKMAQWLAPKDDDGTAEEPKAKYIKRNNIHIDFNKRELKTEEDVEAYLDALKVAYLERIHQNLKITL